MRNFLKRVYTLLPFKKQLFLILRIFPIPGRIFRHLYFKGLISVSINDKNFKIFHYGFQLENEVFWKGLVGGWEKTSINIWIELSRKSRTIIDIGANTGLFALVSRTVNDQATVVAFEPVLRVFQKLEKNIELNDYNIIPERKGISNFEGTATIFDLPSEHIYSVTINENTQPPDQQVIPTTIDVTTVDKYCKDRNLGEIDLLKIDVEMHEPAVLEGAIGVLTKFRPAMIIEILTEKVARQVTEILKGLDYVYFELNEETGPVLRSEIRPHQFTNYLICQKSDAIFLKLDVRKA
jgi:FkbM family methyltransferase